MEFSYGVYITCGCFWLSAIAHDPPAVNLLLLSAYLPGGAGSSGGLELFGNSNKWVSDLAGGCFCAFMLINRFLKVL